MIHRKTYEFAAKYGISTNTCTTGQMNEYAFGKGYGNGDAGADDAGMLEWHGTKLLISFA